MRRTLSVGLVLGMSLATVVAACSSTPPATPAPTVETPSWDPRKDQIDQAAAIWDRQEPPGYAYTFDHAGASGDGASWGYRVSGLEGDVEVQHVVVQAHAHRRPAAGEGERGRAARGRDRRGVRRRLGQRPGSRAVRAHCRERGRDQVDRTPAGDDLERPDARQPQHAGQCGSPRLVAWSAA